MRKSRLVPVALILLIGLGLTALAQTRPTSTRTARQSDRFFIAFIEDTDIVDRQWWEGQFDLSDGDSVDANILRGVAAFQPWDDLELGGRIGFGNTDTSSGLPDGSGATDFDLWGKYHLGTDANDTDFAIGTVLTIPTGDDTAGLGTDAFSAGLFGALRYKLPYWTFAAHAGVRFNGDAQFLGLPEVDGETSGILGGGAIIPATERVTLIVELNYEGERFKGGDADIRAVGGVNVHDIGRGMIRGAISIGLDDGAPDAQLLFGYASEF